MNKQQILENKIAQLCGEEHSPIDEAGLALIEQDLELKKEIAFLEAIWSQETLPMQHPSSDLDLGFYKMLASAQAAQTQGLQTKDHLNATSSKPNAAIKESISYKIKQWFTLQPTAQFASLVVVFLLGFYLNNSSNTGSSNQQLNALNEQVSSLNTMMAISLLQQPNASERLAGVAFTQKANLQHQELANLMLQTLREDSATPVKLAIINALSGHAIHTFEDSLLDIIKEENNVLVQIELSRLLYTQGSKETVQTLLKMVTQDSVHPDMQQWFKDIQATSSI